MSVTASSGPAPAAAQSALPDFLVIGAARAGTTTLHAWLRQSPQIFMPRLKEPNFFAYEDLSLAVRGPGAEFINNSVTRLGDYRALFAPAPGGAIRGEASPLYLYEPRAPERIRAHVPGVRMVVILRNPVEQAWSHYLYARRNSIEPCTSFTEALMREDERLAAGWQPLFGYSRFPRYGEQLARYLDLFPRESFLIRDYAQLRADPSGLVADILGFVGADPGTPIDVSDRRNEGGQPRNPRLQQFLMRPNPVTGAIGLVMPLAMRRAIRDRIVRANLRRGEGMPPEARAILRERLAEDVARLGRLLGRDFSAWLE